MIDVTVPPKVLPVTPENYPAEIPEFTSEAEERDFWDTHDSTFYFADGVDASQEPDPSDLVRRTESSHPPRPSRWTGEDFGERAIVRFSSPEMEEVRKRAGTLGIGVEELLRRWIVEALAAERVTQRESA